MPLTVFEGNLVQRKNTGGVVDAPHQFQVVFGPAVAADKVAPDHEPGPAGLLFEGVQRLGQLSQFTHGDGFPFTQGCQLVVMGLLVVPAVDIGRQDIHILVSGVEEFVGKGVVVFLHARSVGLFP